MDKRLQSIDLLRGIAIFLVVLCHSSLNGSILYMGWVGVDLFFVLSGFLVSGLLFHEYKKTGAVHTGRFLARRGFKIYPLFWFHLLMWLAIDFITINYLKESQHSFSWCGSCYLHELLFVQNYLPGRGYITWSLAIEEHFYFFLAFVVWLMVIKGGLFGNKRFLNIFCISIFALCNLLRLWNVTSEHGNLNIFQTQFRLDELLFGTFLAYHYHLSNERFTKIIRNHRMIWIAIIVVFLAFITWWTLYPGQQYLYTIGFTLLSISFGLILALLVSTEDIEQKLSKWLSKPVLKFFTFMGYYSYSIYLFHSMVQNVFMPAIRRFITFPSRYLEFLVYFSISIVLSVLLSKIIEIPFLKLRDKLFPKKEQTVTPVSPRL